MLSVKWGQGEPWVTYRMLRTGSASTLTMLDLLSLDVRVRFLCVILLGIVLLRKVRAWTKRRSFPLPPGPDARWFSPGARYVV